MLMNIFVGILGVIETIGIFYLIFVFSKKKDFGNSREIQKIYEKIVRVEGEVDKVIPKISDEFRENRKEISENFDKIQTSNEKKLEQMRETVDEKLKESVEKRFNESFRSISRQLTQVYEGLGEMKNLANGVGDLKKVMEGVKTRGIYGEVQLSAIMHDILPNNSFSENVVTKKHSNDRVEFAIKLPGKNDETVFLPIDSKFPVENYQRLLNAYDDGDKALIEKYRKELGNDLKTQAKKIKSKYIDPPYTTDYAILFLPTESLYAEVYRIPGIAEEIRQELNIVVVSPSTLPMVLNGLLTGFRTLAIEKRSAEVWTTLGAVKTQFGKFGDLLDGVQKKLQESANKIESAKTTSRQIEKKLRDVQSLPENQSEKMLEN